MPLAVGDTLDGKYRIVRQIGRGGMGEVWEGENVRIRRRVAIKILHETSAQRADLVTRFEREAQAAGRIGSDHILDVLDLGSLPNGDRYMVMEYLDGEPLSERFRRMGAMTPHQIAPIMLQVLNGLHAAHQAGIVHRDLKPDNLFLLRKRVGAVDFVKIIDFGISKFSVVNAAPGDMVGMTSAGAMMGTPLYMAPEQANGSSEADARTDVYAIGVILYRALSGRVPFHADTFNELLFQIVLAPVPPIETVVPGIDPEFASIIGRAMARDRNQRFQSAQEMANALESWMSRNGVFVGTHTPLYQGQGQASQMHMHLQMPSPQQVTQADVISPHHQGGYAQHQQHQQQPHQYTPNTPYPQQSQQQTPQGGFNQATGQMPVVQQPSTNVSPVMQPSTNVSWTNQAEAAAPTPEPPKSKPPAFVLVGIIAVMLGVLGTGAYFAVRTLAGSEPSTDTKTPAKKKKGGETEDPSSPSADPSSSSSAPSEDPTTTPPSASASNDVPAPPAASAPSTPTAPSATSTKPASSATTKPAASGKPGKPKPSGTTPDFGY